MSSWPSLQNSFAMANQTRGLPQMRIKLCTVSAGLQIVLLLTVLPQGKFRIRWFPPIFRYRSIHHSIVRRRNFLQLRIFFVQGRIHARKSVNNVRWHAEIFFFTTWQFLNNARTIWKLTAGDPWNVVSLSTTYRSLSCFLLLFLLINLYNTQYSQI